ncbi:ATP-dependent Clp protease ATP-binding subunit ClpX [bacterium]|jgi:ATP-dependent Clp protease ATP-binding subunit ClpX|nr:ATP-dependent Clp protease ATP-binding subunit ClpX [bacterium]
MNENNKILASSCSFCGTPEKEAGLLLSNEYEDSHICMNCLDSMYVLLNESNCIENVNLDFENKKEDNVENSIIIKKPFEIKSLLDEYIINQEEAKSIMSTSIYNHYKRIQWNEKSDIKIEKSNLLFAGPTGSGKTLIAKIISKYLNIPMVTVDATLLTESGYMGDDIENSLVRLYKEANNDMSLAEKGIIFIDEFDKIAKKNSHSSKSKDISGEGVQQTLLKIIEGADIEIPLKNNENQSFLFGNEESKSKINTSNILFIFSGAFAGIEDIVKSRLSSKKLGFKVNTKETNNKDKADNTELKHKIEISDFVNYGFINELMGRIPVITIFDQLQKKDLVSIIKEPKNSLLEQYKLLFNIDGIKLDFNDEAIELIAETALKRETGARGLRSIFEKILQPIMFSMVNDDVKEIIITKEVVLKNI